MDEENTGSRSFAVMFAKLADGVANAQASTKLHELTRKLARESKARRSPVKGKITITIELTAEASGMVGATYDVATREPKLATERGILWATDDGHLVERDPRQIDLPLRVVEGQAAAAPRALEQQGNVRALGERGKE